MVRPSVSLRIPQMQYLLQKYGAGAFGPRKAKFREFAFHALG
jgi:hypothetical protein